MVSHQAGRLEMIDSIRYRSEVKGRPCSLQAVADVLHEDPATIPPCRPGCEGREEDIGGLLVEFEKMPPSEHADQYFGLAEDLERLFGRPVDLVEAGPIRNPYFRKSLEDTQVEIYAAA